VLISGGRQVNEFSYEGDAPSSSVSIALTEDPSQYPSIPGPPAPPPAWTIDIWCRTTTGKFALGRHREQSPAPTSDMAHARIIATAYCPGAVQWYARVDGSEFPEGVNAELELSALPCCAAFGVQRVRYLDHPIVSHSGLHLCTPIDFLALQRNFRRTRAQVWNSDPIGTGSILVVHAYALPVVHLAPGDRLDVRGAEAIFVSDGAGPLAATASYWEESDGL